jgi:hypothetical protein
LPTDCLSSEKTGVPGQADSELLGVVESVLESPKQWVVRESDVLVLGLSVRFPNPLGEQLEVHGLFVFVFVDQKVAGVVEDGLGVGGPRPRTVFPFEKS